MKPIFFEAICELKHKNKNNKIFFPKDLFLALQKHYKNSSTETERFDVINTFINYSSTYKIFLYLTNKSLLVFHNQLKSEIKKIYNSIGYNAPDNNGHENYIRSYGRLEHKMIILILLDMVGLLNNRRLSGLSGLSGLSELSELSEIIYLLFTFKKLKSSSVYFLTTNKESLYDIKRLLLVIKKSSFLLSNFKKIAANYSEGMGCILNTLETSGLLNKDNFIRVFEIRNGYPEYTTCEIKKNIGYQRNQKKNPSFFIAIYLKDLAATQSLKQSDFDYIINQVYPHNDLKEYIQNKEINHNVKTEE